MTEKEKHNCSTQHLFMMGNEMLLSRRVTAFFCSKTTITAHLYASILKWISSLNADSDCVAVGFLTPAECFAVRMLAKFHIPFVLMLSMALPQSPGDVASLLPSIPVEQLLRDGQMLVLSVNNNAAETFATIENARNRNMWMMNFAPFIVVAHVTPHGKLHRQLAGRPHVLVLG